LIHICHVRDEHGREVGVFAAVAAGELRVDAVHVKLSVADVVVPRPSHDGVAILHALGNGEIECVHAVNAVGFGITAWPRSGVSSFGTLILPIKIQQGVSGTALLDGIDDFPVLWVLHLRCFGFVCDADLAGATAMDGSICTITSVKGEELRRARLHDLTTRLRDMYLVAEVTWEVAAVSEEWVLDCIAGDGHWRREKEMGIHCQSEAGGYQSCCDDVERHGGCSERVCAKLC
jgi:hypothetical protein